MPWLDSCHRSFNGSSRTAVDLSAVRAVARITWEIEAFFTNGPIAIVRIYAVPPNGNRAALMSAMFNLKDFRKLERDVPPSRPSQAKPPRQP